MPKKEMSVTKGNKACKTDLETIPFNLYSRPALVQIDMTNNCNFNCSYCYNKGYTGNQQLSDSELHKIANEIIEDVEPLFVSFSGGEPLLRKDILLELAKKFSDNGIKLDIYTNGTLLNDEVARKLAELKINMVYTNLESHSPYKHNKIRGVKNGFEKTMEGIKSLKKYLDNDKITVTTVITKSNYNEIIKIAEILDEKKVRNYKFIDYIPTRKKDEKEMLTKEEWKKFHKHYKKIEEQFNIDIEPNHAMLFLEKYKQKNKEQKLPFCMAGRVKIIIRHDGKLVPCNFLKNDKFSIGNVRKENIMDRWKGSKLLQKLRYFNPKDDDCNGCYITELCKGGCRALAYHLNGDLYSLDPYCKNMELGE